MSVCMLSVVYINRKVSEMFKGRNSTMVRWLILYWTLIKKNFSVEYIMGILEKTDCLITMPHPNCYWSPDATSCQHPHSHLSNGHHWSVCRACQMWLLLVPQQTAVMATELDRPAMDVTATTGYTWHKRKYDTSGGRFKNTYELLNLRALKFSPVNKIDIFQCMGKIFCVEFQRVPLKFHTKYFTHTLKDTIFIHMWNFKSS